MLKYTANFKNKFWCCKEKVFVLTLLFFDILSCRITSDKGTGFRQSKHVLSCQWPSTRTTIFTCHSPIIDGAQRVVSAHESFLTWNTSLCQVHPVTSLNVQNIQNTHVSRH